MRGCRETQSLYASSYVYFESFGAKIHIYLYIRLRPCNLVYTFINSYLELRSVTPEEYFKLFFIQT
jgi:hypothetical protein